MTKGTPYVDTISSVADTPYRRLLGTEGGDAFDDDLDDQIHQVLAAITDLPRQLPHDTGQDETVANPIASFQRTTREVERIRAFTLESHLAIPEQINKRKKLRFLLSFHREHAIEFWHTSHINPETTLQDILTKFKKEYHKKTSKKFHGTNGSNQNLIHKQKISTNHSTTQTRWQKSIRA